LFIGSIDCHTHYNDDMKFCQHMAETVFVRTAMSGTMCTVLNWRDSWSHYHNPWQEKWTGNS